MVFVKSESSSFDQNFNFKSADPAIVSTSCSPVVVIVVRLVSSPNETFNGLAALVPVFVKVIL